MNSILILHGWGHGCKSWQKTKELLEKKGYKVFVPDMPGFGAEPAPLKPWSVTDYANWVLNFCANNGELAAPFFLLGHSFGGRVAIKIASQNPQNIKKLVLIDSAGVETEAKLNIRQRITVRLAKGTHFLTTWPVAKELYPYLRKTAYILAGTRDYYLINNPIMKETFKKVIAEDLTSNLSQIKIPTLIVWGKYDKLVPVETSYSINEKIQGSKLKIFENIGHNPHLECPEKLVDEIVDFIK